MHPTHRFGSKLRTQFLEDLGHDRQFFPIRSEEGLRYLRVRGERKGIINDGLKYSSEKWLIGLMFTNSMLSAALCGLAICDTTIVIYSLANEGQSLFQILDIITNATRP